MTDTELTALLLSRVQEIEVEIGPNTGTLHWSTDLADFKKLTHSSTIYSNDVEDELIALPTEAENTRLVNVWYQSQLLKPFGLTHPDAEWLSQFLLS